MRINCFRAGRREGVVGLDEAPRPVKLNFRRTGTNETTSSSKSRSSITSNSSIATLPPCKRVSDPEIEAMMMPVPPEPRPSRCLRLSQPKTYSSIVDSMKACKGCRDWRSFDVFYDDEVDMTLSAELEARRRAAETAKKIARYRISSTAGPAAHVAHLIP